MTRGSDGIDNTILKDTPEEKYANGTILMVKMKMLKDRSLMVTYRITESIRKEDKCEIINNLQSIFKW